MAKSPIPTLSTMTEEEYTSALVCGVIDPGSEEHMAACKEHAARNVERAYGLLYAVLHGYEMPEV